MNGFVGRLELEVDAGAGARGSGSGCPYLFLSRGKPASRTHWRCVSPGGGAGPG